MPPRWKAVLLAFLWAALAPAVAAAQSDNIRWTGTYKLNADGKTGHLNLMASIDPGYHIYDTEDVGNRLPTDFKIGKDVPVKVTEKFIPDVDAEIGFAPEDGSEEKHFSGIVTWSAPIEFDAAAAPPDEFPVTISGQICDDRGCNNFRSTIAVRRAGAKPTTSDSKFRPADTHVSFQGSASPKFARPGETVTLRIEAEADKGWTIPELISEEAGSAEQQNFPTIVVLNKTNGWRVHPVESESKGDSTPSDKAVWIVRIDVPASAEQKKYGLGGVVAVPARGKDTDNVTSTAAFRMELLVASVTEPGQIPLEFADGSSYEQVKSVHMQRMADDKERAGKYANYSIPTVMALAFLGGFILNFMPCVLPVIGLKIMSFVQQAGEHPARVFFLNVAFAVGVMAVFMVLAVVATRTGWGGLFQEDVFQIVMIGVVFSFALSFLGVWEIPIPGLSGSSVAGKLAARDGFFGAFIKGVITTLLATPCAGPFVIPAIVWALAQPPLLTYLTFAAMGMGLALPYLILGAFPKLVAVLPRPGNWMVTFKHLMGFAMLGAAIFLFGSLKEKFAIPTLSLALAIGMACWVIGHTSVAAEWFDRLKAWAWGLAIVVFGTWVSFFVLISQHELEWNTFSNALLEQKLQEGKIVFVDFTADWCATCKSNERMSLNTRITKQYFQDNNIVALKAKRDKNPEVDPFLEKIGNVGKGIPYYAVFKPGFEEPWQFDGLFITSSQMIKQIEPAVSARVPVDNTAPPVALR